jgi:hypothetical protein
MPGASVLTVAVRPLVDLCSAVCPNQVSVTCEHASLEPFAGQCYRT